MIERAGTNAGMPVGPLALMDEVSLELMHKVMRQTEADLGVAYKAQPQDPVLIRMVEELKRLGRKSGAGCMTTPPMAANACGPNSPRISRASRTSRRWKKCKSV